MSNAASSDSIRFGWSRARWWAVSLMAFTGLGHGLAAQASSPRNPGLFPIQAHAFGQSYAEWSANWWTWYLEHPLAGHPGVDDPSFDVTSGQSGDVWFLAAPFGTSVRVATIPEGKALFVGMLAAEWSSLEDPEADTRQEQLDVASYLADHAVALSGTLDGRSLASLASYRFQSPQFSFTSPSPNIFYPDGGTGTGTSDGYYVFLKPLAPGTHVLHYSGAFVFTLEQDGFDLFLPLDATWILEVVPE